MDSRCKQLVLILALIHPTDFQLCWSWIQICRIGLVGLFELKFSQMVVAWWLVGPSASHVPGALVQLETFGGLWENSP